LRNDLITSRHCYYDIMTRARDKIRTITDSRQNEKYCGNSVVSNTEQNRIKKTEQNIAEHTEQNTTEKKRTYIAFILTEAFTAYH